MAVRLVGNVIVVVHTVMGPSNEEWEEYIQILSQARRLHGDDLSTCKQLMLTDGGGPSTAQRAALIKAMEELPGATRVPGAVVSESTFVRGIVTAFNWLDLNFKLFPPDDVDRAIAFLQIEDGTLEAIWEELAIVNEEIGPIEMIRLVREAYGAPS
jgi:hypothetical protein